MWSYVIYAILCDLYRLDRCDVVYSRPLIGPSYLPAVIIISPIMNCLDASNDRTKRDGSSPPGLHSLHFHFTSPRRRQPLPSPSLVDVVLDLGIASLFLLPARLDPPHLETRSPFTRYSAHFVVSSSLRFLRPRES